MIVKQKSKVFIVFVKIYFQVNLKSGTLFAITEMKGIKGGRGYCLLSHAHLSKNLAHFLHHALCSVSSSERLPIFYASGKSSNFTLFTEANLYEKKKCNVFRYLQS